jgi:hypothetical protein
MAGDWFANHGRWSGVRMGVHPPGITSWGIGLAGRLVLDFLAQCGVLPVPSLLASPVAGFLIAALAYAVMARVGMERPAVPVETFPSGA